MHIQNLKKAVLFSTGFGLSYSLMSLFAKTAIQETSNNMIVFFRFSICCFYIAIIFGIRHLKGKSISIKTPKIKMHLMRAAAAVLTNFAMFYALKSISMVDANLLFMTNALFIPLLGTLLFRTKTTWKNWLAIIVGFIGVMLILRPTTSGIFQIGSFIGLSAGFFAALSMLGVHEVSKTDGPYTIMFYYFFITFVVSCITVLFKWVTPSSHVLLLLIGIGAISILVQECATRTLMSAPAKIAAPLMYSSIIFSGLFDWLFWSHKPDLFTIIGGIIICSGSAVAVSFAKNDKAI